MSVTDQNMPALPANEAADEVAMKNWAERLVARALTEGVELTGDGGLLTGLVRQVLQCGLEVEMAEHLGYERHAPEGRGTPKWRNGSSPKRLKTDVGEVDLRVPRDRAGTFEPVTVPKYQRRLDGVSGNVISLYAKGLTTGEIQAHLAEIYDTEVSRATISKITDEIVADMAVWQNRPLDAIYPVLLIDAIAVKVRDAQVANRPVYVAIGSSTSARKISSRSCNSSGAPGMLVPPSVGACVGTGHHDRNRAPTDGTGRRLHHQRRREPQRQVPKSRAASRPLPQRASRDRSSTL